MTDHVLREVPVGIQATGTRRERDSLGIMEVPADKYWGAVTQRALRAYPASIDGMPKRFYQCYGYVKRAAALINGQAGELQSWKAAAIARAADDLIAGLLADQFPLPIWQAGSGRDADTNVNEVLANRAVQLLGGVVGSHYPVDAARDVNKAQSVGGTFTISMYLATVIEIEEIMMPRGSALARSLDRRPHLSASHDGRLAGRLPGRLPGRLRAALERLDEAEGGLHEVGGIPEDGEGVSEMSAERWKSVVATFAADTARPFIVAPNGLSARESLGAMMATMAAIRGIADVLLDIAEAIQMFEPTNEASSRHAQAEAVATICAEIIGQEQVVTAATWRGGRVSRAMRPLIVTSVLHSVRRLAEACEVARRVLPRIR